MKTRIQKSTTGGIRFIHEKPLKIGAVYMHIGQKVKVVGVGMAGMPEVKSKDGTTCLAFPHDLKPVK